MVQMRHRYNTRSNEGNAAPRSPYTPSGLPPVADAGPDQVVRLETMVDPTTGTTTTSVNVNFDGSASYDPDNGTNPGDGIVSYKWRFGDGDNSTGTGATPSHTYTSTGIYTVELTVTDDENESDTDTMVVAVKAPPVADAGDDQTVELDSNTNSVSVSFDGSNSYDPDGGALTYAWNFGDGDEDTEASTGSGATPSHTYTSTGTYTVTLTVTDDEGDKASDSLTVTVSEAISLTLTGPDTVTRGDATRYTASITPEGLTLDTTPTFNWKYTADIGGNTVRVTERIGATSQNPQSATWSGTMVKSGTLEVRTTVNGTEYVQALNVTVTDRVWGTDVPITTYTTSWGTEAPRQHSDLGDVEYDIPFTASDDLDAAAVSSGPNKGILYVASLNLTAPFTVRINRHFGMAAADLPPTWVAFKNANTRYDEIETKVKARLGFDGTTSGTLYGSWEDEIHFSDPKANLEDFMEVPGGELSDYENQIAYYLSSIGGNRIASMNGYESGWSLSGITINYDYLAADAGEDQTVDVDTDVTFDGSASCVPAGRTINATNGYSWNFGSDADPATGSGVSPSCTYSTYGEKTVTLTVTDSGGNTDSDTMMVAVEAPPVADAGDDQTVHVNTDVTFDGSGSHAHAGRTIEGYYWNFGSDATPATGTGLSPSCTYSTHGEKTVNLIVRDSGGDTDSDEMTVTVKAPPVADPGSDKEVYFNSNTNSVSVSFDGSNSYDPDDGTNPGDGIVSYAWSFGNGSTGSGATPSHTYTSTGTYTAILTVRDNEQVEASNSLTVTVQPDPGVLTAEAGPNQTVSAGSTVTFDGSGSYAPAGRTIDTYAWDFGDGTRGTGAQATHTYSAHGVYNVTLTITDDQDNTATDDLTLTVFQLVVDSDNTDDSLTFYDGQPGDPASAQLKSILEPADANITAEVDFEIYPSDTETRRVKRFGTVAEGTANTYSVSWDGSSDDGDRVPEGTYSVIGTAVYSASNRSFRSLNSHSVALQDAQLIIITPPYIRRGKKSTFKAIVDKSALKPTFQWKYTMTFDSDEVVIEAEGTEPERDPENGTYSSKWEGIMVHDGTLEVTANFRGSKIVESKTITVTDRDWETNIPFDTDNTCWGTDRPSSYKDLVDKSYKIIGPAETKPNPPPENADLAIATVPDGPNRGCKYVETVNVNAPFKAIINQNFERNPVSPNWENFKNAQGDRFNNPNIPDEATCAEIIDAVKKHVGYSRSLNPPIDSYYEYWLKSIIRQGTAYDPARIFERLVAPPATTIVAFECDIRSRFNAQLPSLLTLMSKYLPPDHLNGKVIDFSYPDEDDTTDPDETGAPDTTTVEVLIHEQSDDYLVGGQAKTPATILYKIYDPGFNNDPPTSSIAPKAVWISITKDGKLVKEQQLSQPTGLLQKYSWDGKNMDEAFVTEYGTYTVNVIVHRDPLNPTDLVNPDPAISYFATSQIELVELSIVKPTVNGKVVLPNIVVNGTVGSGLSIRWCITVGGQEYTTVTASGLEGVLQIHPKKFPEFNSDFGPNIITATAIHGNKTFGCKSVDIKCFFSKYGYDHYRLDPRIPVHEDEDIAREPNFYFYWKQTSANTGNHIYADSDDLSFAGSFLIAHEPNPQPSYFRIHAPAAKNIDEFAKTCIHEQQHLLDMHTMWPKGYPANSRKLEYWDKDRDHVRDDFEGEYGKEGWRHFLPTERDTDGDTHRDFEDRGYDAQEQWIDGSADSEDWSEGGAQWMD